MLHFIAGFALGAILLFPIVFKRSRTPDWMCEEKEIFHKLDSIIARIEERDFENAFRLGQEAERTKHLAENKEAL